MARTFPDWIEQHGLIARELKMMFVPTPKVGCTAIMWAMALAEGTAQPPSVISSRGEQSRDQTIHDPVIHGLPSLASLGAKERRSVFEDPDWIRFCVTRDPYSRLLSGWINRVLLYSPDALGADLAFARESVASAAQSDLGEMFRWFVSQLLAPTTPVITDGHFVPQVSLIRPDVFPYTDVVNLRELDAFTARVAASSTARRTFESKSMNVSLRLDSKHMFDAETAAAVDAYFAADFEQLSYRRVDFPQTAGPVPLSARELQLIAIVREKSDRLHDLQQVNAPPPTLGARARRLARSIRRRVRLTR